MKFIILFVYLWWRVQELVKQRESCDLFISSKNKLINDYALELKAKDDEYVKELKRQAEEIGEALSII